MQIFTERRQEADGIAISFLSILTTDMYVQWGTGDQEWRHPKISFAHAHNPKLLPTSSDFPQVMQLWSGNYLESPPWRAGHPAHVGPAGARGRVTQGHPGVPPAPASLGLFGLPNNYLLPKARTSPTACKAQPSLWPDDLWRSLPAPAVPWSRAPEVTWQNRTRHPKGASPESRSAGSEANPSAPGFGSPKRT